MADVILRDIIERLNGVYKSIDLRAALIKEGEEWYNALMVIRFSCEDVETIQKTYGWLRERWGEIDTDVFRVILKAMNTNEMESVHSQLLGGYIEWGDVKIKFGTPKIKRRIDLLSLKGRVPTPTSYLRDERWPSFEGYIGDYSLLFEKEDVKQGVRLLNFPDIYSAVNAFLEIKFARGLCFDLVVHAPFYGVIRDTSFEGQLVKTKVKFHKDIGGLRLDVFLREEGHGGKLKERHSLNVCVDGTEGLDENFMLWEGSTELPRATANDRLTVELIHTGKPILPIGHYDESINALMEIKKHIKNPLFGALTQFCNLDKIRMQLLEPYKLKKKGMGPDKIFERAISWLLALSGFCSIKLDEYEKFREQSKVERYSLDILAFHEGKGLLLPVNCTIGIPEDADILNLRDLKREFFELFKGGRIQIIPIIFSAREGLELIKKGKAIGEGVKLVDAGDIDNILCHIRDGKVELAFDFLSKT